MKKPSISAHYSRKNLWSKNEPFIVLQLTDLHIRSTDVNSTYLHSRAYLFELLLKQALDEQANCDLIVLTGDLVDDIDPKIYDWIFDVMTKTGIPFICISGNHDVTDEVGHEDTPFENRDLVAYQADNRLISRQIIETAHWQILFLDSSVAGKVSGYIDEQTLSWLSTQLQKNSKSALICLHHHILPMDSLWLDKHITLNYSDFWDCINAFKQVKITLCGHVHQEFSTEYQDVSVYTTPATSYQFTPKEDKFTIDNKPPGYRWLYLYANGRFNSEVKRLQT